MSDFDLIIIGYLSIQLLIISNTTTAPYLDQRKGFLGFIFEPILFLLPSIIWALVGGVIPNESIPKREYLILLLTLAFSVVLYLKKRAPGNS